MYFREYLNELKKSGKITSIKKEVSIDIEAAAVLKAAEPTPLLFENVKGYSDFQVSGNVFCTKESIADYFKITTADLIPKLTAAIDNRNPRKSAVRHVKKLLWMELIWINFQY
ncbi:MAG: UbiD family decarboxylase [Candidatus Heimdallarchaeota archaeon]|nr:MAG: UbiD family decarboxylase [Candidatus Heimdallarchaeota archaeon]